MQYFECPHCGHENQVFEPEEEPTCELCDGYLEDGGYDEGEERQELEE